MSNRPLLNVVVHRVNVEAKHILSLELRDSNGAYLPDFVAGSHVDLHLANGLIRSYSLFNSPAERHRYVVGVLNDKNSRGGSRYVHEQLRVGSTLSISAPRNNFPLHESPAASAAVLIAGGIGITPILCMFKRLRDLQQSATLLYCARSRDEAAFFDELDTMDNVDFHFDAEVGQAPDLHAYLKRIAPDSHVYCCGPAPMITAFEKACDALGLVNVHVERFSAEPIGDALQNDAYQVVLAKTGRTIEVPEGRSLLEVLLDEGIAVDYSCREGVCGACETGVLDGHPDHRDSILTKAERQAGKTMMVCVSGCKDARLTLDL